MLIVRDGLWALNKPAGMPVHAAGAGGPQDLVSWALSSADAPEGLAPIHRLDQGTSGLVLLSPDAAVRARLGQAFAADKQVRKTYLALVAGRPHKKGVIRRPLADPRRKRPLEAITRYWIEEKLGRAALMRVRPETGRRHQIRRHLAGVGCPVVGDARHGRRAKPVPGAPDRLWLHCARLQIPAEGVDLRAPLAPELTAHLEALRATPGR